MLRRKYSFDCACEVCGLGGVALERSEARQARLARLHPAIYHPHHRQLPRQARLAELHPAIYHPHHRQLPHQARLAELHRELSTGAAESVVSLLEEMILLMRDEGVPLVWAQAGFILAIVHLRTRGDLRMAARLAHDAASAARIALGEDSSVYRKFARLAGTEG